MEYSRRIASLRKKFDRLSVDAVLVTHAANVTYLSGFQGHDASLLITRKGAYLITDSRYLEDAKNTVPGMFRIELAVSTMFESIVSIVKDEGVKNLGFEGSHIPYKVFLHLKKYIGNVRLSDMQYCLEDIRAVKDPDEINKIRRSVKLAGKILKRTAELIKPGMIEEDIARKIEVDFLEHGARQSFQTIVAAGSNSSKPHARPGFSRIVKNSFVMIDLGCVLDGYCSDITRMIVTGKVGARFKKIYHIVKTAQQRAIALIRNGATIGNIDMAARSYIEQKGYGKNFGHSLGHGVGLEIHEGPSISSRNDAKLKSGMIFTVEPAIYLPGFGGVRIEDMVLVKQNGCDILTR